jgi:hypothetical protein
MDRTNGLVVVDVNPGVVADALRHVDVNTLENSAPRYIRFIVGSDVERVFAEFYGALSYWPRLDYCFWLHPGTQRAFGHTYEPLLRRFADKVRVDMLQRTTVRNLSQGWLRNAIRNLPQVLDSRPIDAFQGVFSGCPAAIVAAGPSLGESLDLLRELRNRMLIIAVGTAYRPLRAAGIDPHIVVLVDGSPLIAKQFEDVRTDAGLLLIPPQIDPHVVERFRGRLVFWQSGALPEVRDWLAKFAEAPTGSLRAGGTVTFSAIDAALYMGCNRIYAFGLDLSFRDDGQTHADNTMYNGYRWESAGLIAVPGNRREQVWTTRQFATYIELMAELAMSVRKKGDCRLVNVNSDGAVIPNMERSLPSEVNPDDFPTIPDVANRLQCADDPGMVPEQILLKLIRKTVSELDELSEHAQQAADLCRELAEIPDRFSQHGRNVLEKLERTEKRLAKPTPAGLMLSAAVRASSMDTVAFCAGVADSDKDGHKRVHEVCAGYYSRLETEIAWLRRELEDARKQIEIQTRPATQAIPPGQ